VREGRSGSMHYLQRTDDAGQTGAGAGRNLFPWARSAVVCFAGYHAAQPRSMEAAKAGAG